jgi:hypothetical protein
MSWFEIILAVFSYEALRLVVKDIIFYFLNR